MGKPEVLRGTTGLVMPDRAALLKRLNRVKKALEGTKFQFRESNDSVETVCPWGNRITVHEPDPTTSAAFSSACPMSASTCGRAPPAHRPLLSRRGGGAGRGEENGAGPEAKVQVGENHLYFRKTDTRDPDYDGHHVQIYLTNFSRPYRKLLELGLITIEDDDFQYRFRDIIDLDSKEVLFTVEHETRSATNPMYGRPLINRNPAATNIDYKPGHDEHVLGAAVRNCGRRPVKVPRALRDRRLAGGLMVAHLLRSIGWDAAVFERNDEELASRGVGLGTHPQLIAILKRAGVAFDESMGIAPPRGVCLDGDGRIIIEQPMGRTLSGWSRLYQPCSMRCRRGPIGSARG